MTNIVTIERIGRWSGWRYIGWGSAAALMLLPLVAMQFTDEVRWTGADFVFAALMFGTVGGLLELAVRTSDQLAFRIGAGIALLAGFLLVWINGAVGIIGDEGNPANLMFGAVLLIAIAGAVGAGSRSMGLARAMAAAAIAQLAVGAVALGDDRAVLPATIVFAAMWVASALLFRSAAAASLRGQ